MVIMNVAMKGILLRRKMKNKRIKKETIRRKKKEKKR